MGVYTLTQYVFRVIGNDEITGSNPVDGTTFPHDKLNLLFIKISNDQKEYEKYIHKLLMFFLIFNKYKKLNLSTRLVKLQITFY